jgi:hypothetical protein
MKKRIGFIKRRALPLLALSAALLFLLPQGCSRSVVRDPGRIEDQVRRILSIPTREYRYRDLIYIDESRSVLSIRTVDRRLLFGIDISITAGIDLNGDFSISLPSPGKALVTIPAATILSADADEESIRQYFSREVGGSVSWQTYYGEIERKKGIVTEDAVARGILREADENARAMVRNLLAALGFTEIVFTPPEASNPGSSSSSADLGAPR